MEQEGEQQQQLQIFAAGAEAGAGHGQGVGGVDGVGDAGAGGHEERNTRASRWSMHETLVLIAAKRKESEEDRDARTRGKIYHDSNKWSMVGKFCNERGVHRDASQCKKRWHSLYTEYKKIKDYDRENPENASYWHISSDKRRESTLAPMFEREIFDQMDGFLSGNSNGKLGLTDNGNGDAVVPIPAADPAGALETNNGVAAGLEGPETHSQGSSMEAGGTRNDAGAEKNHRASRWTVHETLVLILAKKTETLEEQDAPKRARTQQEHKKWAAIAQFCNEKGVRRDSMQCKKRWHNLYTEFKKIKQHELAAGVESYWVMSVEKRREYKLARMFEKEVYDSMNEFLAHTPSAATTPAVAMPTSIFKNGHPGSEREPVVPATRDPIPEVEENENNSSRQDSLLDMGGFGSAAFSTGQRKRARRRLLGRDDMPEHKLVAVLERNGKAMQAELAADRELRKEQGKHLIAVFDKLADGLGQIASAIHSLQNK